jgi:Serine dehydrogenase proteinase
MTPNSKRFLLIWFDERGSISMPALTPIRRAIEDAVQAESGLIEIDLWLESPGGDAHAAYKLALLLKAVASKIRVVIPDYAKSAATLLSLAGDEIYLAPGADLGPLDAQMPDEGSYTGSISALNIARAADEVARDAVAMAVEGGADLLAVTGLSRAQTIDAMLRFSASFSEPLVRQLDPKVVHHAKQMLQVTAKYAEQLLRDAKTPYPLRIAKALVETFPTHGYVISRDEARDLGLPILPLESYEFLEKMREVHRTAEEGVSIVEFCSLESVIGTSEESQKGGASNGRSSRKRSAEAKRSAETKRGGTTSGARN